MSLRSISLSIFGFFLTSCFSATSNQGFGNENPETPAEPSRGVSLQVNEGTLVAEVNNQAPLSGGKFALILFTIHNKTTQNGSGEALALSPALFRLEGDDGLQYPISAYFTSVPEACPGDALLNPNAEKTCRLAFELPDEVSAMMLRYDDGLGHQATGTVPSISCSPCGEACVDLQTDQHNCGACGVSVPSGAECSAGNITCVNGRTLCSNVCVDLQTDPGNCGACGNRLADYVNCSDGAPVCTYDNMTYCPSEGRCFDLSDDSENCGSCGNECAASWFCHEEICVFRQATSDDAHEISCNEVCARSDQYCVGGYAYYSGDGSSSSVDVMCDAVPDDTLVLPTGRTRWLYTLYCYCAQP